MSFGSILFALLIEPLKLVFELIYSIAFLILKDPGLSIIALSLAMNILVLPLYKRADAMQEEERNMEQKLHKGVSHIKKTFKGDEQMMMLNTYYRQNNYKPTYVLKGAMSLFLEIPFFIAAYQFLSHLELLQGVTFGPIANLGVPDGLIHIGGHTLNLLPFVMTFVNLISTAIFTKGYPLKTKIQLNGMAIFFLVFLYSSPSGLVFYWTLNNVFSLVKTIFYKLKHPKEILTGLCAILGCVVFGLIFTKFANARVLYKVFFALLGGALELPLLLALFSKFMHFETKATPNSKVFYLGAFILTLLTGALIPSDVIVSSPEEFLFPGFINDPKIFIFRTFLLAAGLFIVWFTVFYKLSNDKAKVAFDYGVFALVGLFFTNYLFFGKNAGVLNNLLRYDLAPTVTHNEKLINLAVLALVLVLCIAVYKYLSKVVTSILPITLVALCILTGLNINKINKAIDAVDFSVFEKQDTYFKLSKNSENVVVLMMDRAMSEYVPYIFNEKPELKEQFSGFTFYENTASFGAYTNFGTPGLFGGYEYTPYEMNKRDSELLVDKHNEALCVMPYIFEEHGYDVTVCSPPWAGYKWTPDLSIYDGHEGISAYYLKDVFGTDIIEEGGTKRAEENFRNFFMYSMLKVSPIAIRNTIYNKGEYHNLANAVMTGGDPKYIAGAPSTGFVSNYNILLNLSNITEISEDTQPSFIMFSNETTHDTAILQEPDYVPKNHVDNTDYETRHADRFIIDGKQLLMEDNTDFSHYQSNMAAMIQLGKWFDYLKANGVYDNTKIIIVSDHGRQTEQIANMVMQYESGKYDLSILNAFLMVKDFNATEFSVSNEFMTNADTPSLAFKDVIADPVNPFTHKKIEMANKENGIYVFGSFIWDVGKNNGTQFIPDCWYRVKDNVWNPENWTRVQDNAVFPE